VSTLAKIDPDISALIGAYADCIDNEHYDKLPDFFTDDCRYRITTYEAYRAKMPIGILECSTKGMLVDRLNSMRDANIFEPQRYRHLLSTSLATRAADGTLTVRTGFAIIRIVQSGESGLFLSGNYHDTVVAHAGELRFRERLVVLDSSRVDTLLVIPI